MAKPMKALELHYPMIQVLINIHSVFCTHYVPELIIDHFTVFCSVTWPLDGSEAGVEALCAILAPGDR